jgi:prenyltransferase beta subunit
MSAKPDDEFMTKRLQRDVLCYVMARWQHDSGGFGFTPTLPASVEDTYHALGILEKIRSVAQNELNTLKGESNLDAFLIKAAEDKENWTLRTAYQYVSSCAFDGSAPDESWLRRILQARLGESRSLSDHYYASRIIKECIPHMENALPRHRPASWRSSRDLWMVLYLHDAEPEQFHATKEDLIQWLQACQSPDGGFGFLPGSTSFIENTQWCLRSLALLGSAPLMRDSAYDFIMRCRTRDGGFARRNGAAPFLYATWHAVVSLALLSE